MNTRLTLQVIPRIASFALACMLGAGCSAAQSKSPAQPSFDVASWRTSVDDNSPHSDAGPEVEYDEYWGN